MIKKDEVFKIGIFNKPHGVKGEISFTFTDDIFDRVECEYLVCLLDGIFVPFFIEEYRFRSDTTALVKLEGVDTSEKARMFTNVEVYFPKKYVGEEEDSDDIPTWNYFIGFKVEDVNHGELGEIVAVDDSTMNVLFALSLIHIYSAFNHFGGISTTALQAFTEFFYTGWLNENRQCAAAIIFFDITSAYHIYVKNHILSGFQLFFHLCFQGSVETVFVYFFVFQKLIIGNALSEFLRR